MDLYLVRHASAVPAGETVPDDASRELTPKGRRRMRRNARSLRRMKVCIEEIWSSPLVRARQTAELLAEELGIDDQLHIEETLSPGSDFQGLLGRLRESQHLSGIALVGHQPDLGRLLTWLLTGQSADGIDFKKGGIAHAQVEDFGPPANCRLEWLLTPGMLRQIC